MILDLQVHLFYHVPEQTDMLLQIEGADLPDQAVRHTELLIKDPELLQRVPADEGIGERLWLRVENEFICEYSARFEIIRAHTDIEGLQATPLFLLPGDTTKYLLPSRYCLPDSFEGFAAEHFGHLEGGAKISAMRNWIKNSFQYQPGSSNSETTVLDSFAQRSGVCRDYAHVLVTLARAAAIPARFVSAYAPFVSPQDFHAVAEVYLEGAWHLVDATGMSDISNIVRIGVGLDAASVAFMTTFGAAEMVEQSVQVSVAA